MLQREGMRRFHWISIAKGIGDCEKTTTHHEWHNQNRCIWWHDLWKMLSWSEGLKLTGEAGHWCWGGQLAMLTWTLMSRKQQLWSRNPSLEKMMEDGGCVDDGDKRSRGRCSWMARKSKQWEVLLKGIEVMVLKWDWGVRRQLTPPHCDQCVNEL